MDNYSAGGVGAAIMTLIGLIYTAINHKRVRSNCCGRFWTVSLDVDNTTPQPSSSVASSSSVPLKVQTQPSSATSPSPPLPPPASVQKESPLSLQPLQPSSSQQKEQSRDAPDAPSGSVQLRSPFYAPSAVGQEQMQHSE